MCHKCNNGLSSFPDYKGRTTDRMKDMNKMLIAGIAATMVVGTSVAADLKLTGTYEGTASTSNGPAAYTQDLDLKMVAKISPDTKVQATFENIGALDKNGDTDNTVKAKQMYIATKLEGLNFKGGSFKSQNGFGLLQKKTLANQMMLSTKIGGTKIGVFQVSGESSATVNTSSTMLGVDIKVQNAGNSDRFISASTSIANVDLKLERQTTTIGTNMALTASTVAQNGLGVTAIWIDVKDASAVTQNDDIIDDISDANDNTTIKAAIITYDNLTGKYIIKNDLTTLAAHIQRGVIEYGYTKTEDTDGVLDATMTVTF